MLPKPEELARDYSRMSEFDLTELGRSYDSLTETAKLVMRAEFARRDLEPPRIEDIPEATSRNLVTVRRYRDLSEAIVARSLLESTGIQVHLRDENLVRLEWQISNFIGGMRLQVEAADESAAIEILDQPIPDTFTFSEQAIFVQPVCPRCGSKEITFEGSSRGVALTSLYLVSLPLPLGQETWLCNACQSRWKNDNDDPVARTGSSAP